MKALICSFTTLSLLVSPTLAQEERLIHAKLVSTTISNGLPKDLPFRDRPFNVKEGATLVFFFQADSIVSFDKPSFFVDGWSKHFISTISSSGKTATITITKKDFVGIFEEIEADGKVDVLMGVDSKTKKLVLKEGADPIKFPFFTMELELPDKNDRFPRSGIKVEGKHNMIQSIAIIREGKEITSNGYSSSNDTKTFRFRDIKDGDEIKVVYWSKLKTKTVKLFK